MEKCPALFVPFSTIDTEDEKLFENLGIVFSRTMIINLENAIGKNKKISLPVPAVDELKNSYNFSVKITDITTEINFQINVHKQGTISYFIFSRGISSGEWQLIKSDSLMTPEEFDGAFPSIIKSFSL
jgi:hypothetical protein